MFQNMLFFHNIYRKYTTTRNIISVLKSNEIGQKVSVMGWIKSIRKQKDVTFLDINDGSTCNNLQIVLSKKINSNITVGSSIGASGILLKSQKGQKEISTDEISLIGECDLKNYPFLPRKTYENEYIREYLHFRPRTRIFSSILRLRHAASLAIHNYLDDNGYFNIHTPIITSNDCEGAGETFKILPENETLLKNRMCKENQPLDEAYFNKKVFLTVSGQLHLEAAVQSLNKVYSFGPTFRAENSRSRFHLSEFYMLELEKAFLNNFDELLTLVEDLIKNVSKHLMDKFIEDIQLCNNKADFSWIEKPFIKITHREALKILKEKFNKENLRDINKENEISLSTYFEGTPVFITEWPKELKPFYMKEMNDNKVTAFDLLVPIVGEIAGGSLREDNYEKLQTKIAGNNFNQLDWYLELRKSGYAPSGGFGLGFERYIQFLLGINNIKDSIPFPRGPHNCKL